MVTIYYITLISVLSAILKVCQEIIRRNSVKRQILSPRKLNGPDVEIVHSSTKSSKDGLNKTMSNEWSQLFGSPKKKISKILYVKQLTHDGKASTSTACASVQTQNDGLSNSKVSNDCIKMSGIVKNEPTDNSISSASTDFSERLLPFCTSNYADELADDFHNSSGIDCPSYKIIENSDISVDAFSHGYIPGVNIYLLSHFHYDHYVGLYKAFKRPIICSQATKSLVQLKLRVCPKYVFALPLNTPYMLPGGCTITLLHSNHCPGAVMFFLVMADGKRILHTGDFRADLIGEEFSFLQLNSPIDLIYLDTTYLNEKFTFPAQAVAVEMAVDIALSYMKQFPKSLVVCGSYTLGKEAVYLAVAKALNSKICVTRNKLAILRCLQDPNLLAGVTTDLYQANVLVQYVGAVTVCGLEKLLVKHRKYDHVLGIIPTGWENASGRCGKPVTTGNISLVGVPYSEHSSYNELRDFITALKPARVIPTVISNTITVDEMQLLLDEWIKT